MKKKTTAIVTSVASMAICASLIAGSTFALFTSESSVNMAVTTANVNVTATAGNLKQYTAKADENGTLQDENGNTYVHTETEGLAQLNGGALVVDAFKPGDKVTFDIEIRNYSTTAVKYNTAVTFGEGNSALAQALTITLGEEQVESLPYSTGYKKLSKANDTEKGDYVATVAVVVELPIETVSVFTEEDHGIQGESAQIAFSVNAVQGNAKTPVKVPQGYTGVENDVQISAALAAGEPVILTGDTSFVNTIRNQYPAMDFSNMTDEDYEKFAASMPVDSWTGEEIKARQEEDPTFLESTAGRDMPLKVRDGQNLVIDLGGSTLTMETDIYVKAGGTLTVRGGTLNFADNINLNFLLYEGATLKLEDAEINLNKTGISVKGAELKIKGCKITSYDTQATIHASKGSKVTIEKSEVSNLDRGSASCAIYGGTNSSLEISNSLITSENFIVYNGAYPGTIWTSIDFSATKTIKSSTLRNTCRKEEVYQGGTRTQVYGENGELVSDVTE